MGTLPVLKSHIPGNQSLKIRMLPVLSQNLADLLPVTLDYSRNHDLTALDLRARSGERCHLDLFSRENLNFNGVVCGASGSGKSFLVNSMVDSLLREGPRVRVSIFDVGGSYRKLVAAKGGKSIMLKIDEATSLLAGFLQNPSPIRSKLAMAVLEVMCGTGGHITHSHRVALATLADHAENTGIRVCELVKSASVRREAYYRDIAHWLSPYLSIDEVRGSSCADISRRSAGITAFDFKELNSHPVLERTSVLILASDIWSDLQEGKDDKTLVVFDEVWRFFKAVKDYVEEMYRTFRKYRAGIVSISQNAADYGNDEFSRMIFSNSFTKIFLEGGANRDLLDAGLDLTASDIRRALSVASAKPKYSEFFVSSGQVSQVMRLYAEEGFYRLANTENITQ